MLQPMEDVERKTTYTAEDMVAEWLDAVDAGTGEVAVDLEEGQRRVVFRPEAEPRFSTPREAVRFVDGVMARLQRQAGARGSNYRGREQRPVEVLSLAGWKQAKYRNGFIFLPEREHGGAWALRAMVVLHELAHHLNTGVDGTIIDQHGEGFRRTFVTLLTDIGWSGIAAMLEEAFRQVGLGRNRPAEDGMLARVGKLLRHAEGAANQAERDAFLSKAQALATAHSIELAVARAAHAAGEAAQSPTFEGVSLGHVGQQANVRYISLMLGIAHANDLRCSIRANNTGVTLYGFREDIDAAKVLYTSLVVQMVADADAYIRSGAHRPVHGRTARVAFYAGWTARIEQRLREAREVTRAEATVRADAADLGRAAATAGASPEGPRTSLELALLAKEVEVDDYFGYMKRQHGIKGTWRGVGQVYDGDSLWRGREAADRARLGREKSLPPPRAALRRGGAER